MSEVTPDFRSGFIAIVGEPNVGKSTLLNQILNFKVSIVSPRPQTTRNRIAGIFSDETCQMVFIDTPGLHNSDLGLNRFMMQQAREAIMDADLVLYLRDARYSQKSTEEEAFTLDFIKLSSKPRILALNKIDTIEPSQLLPSLDRLSRTGLFEELMPISALLGQGVPALLSQLRQRLPVGPRYFPEDQLTDVTERFVVSEIVREKIFLLTHQEVPYATAVHVEQFEEQEGSRLIRIQAVIHVEKDSQKAIVIGKGGTMLKQVGEQARHELEELFGKKVFLGLFVRVDKNWTRNPQIVKRLGVGRF